MNQDISDKTSAMPPLPWWEWQRQVNRDVAVHALSVAAMIAAAALAVLACGFGVAVAEVLAVFVGALAEVPGGAGAGISGFLLIVAILTAGAVAAIIGGAIVLANRK